MKRNFQNIVAALLFIFFFLCLPVEKSRAQFIPNEINYQAIARDGEGKALCNKTVQVKFYILRNSVNGDIEYAESQSLSTNEFGIFTTTIGSGTWFEGAASNLQSVDWGCCSHFLKVELFVGGSSSKIIGTTQLFAVPYALYAVRSGDSGINSSGFGFEKATSQITYKGNNLVDLSPLKQSLSYDPVTSHLTISDSPGVIDLSAFKHPPQDLRLDNDKLFVTGNTESTKIDLRPYKQSLTLTTDGKISISGGNSVSIDTSSVNEIQDLTLTGNALKITKNASSTSIDLSKYLDNTDKQTLSYTPDGKLAISNGNSISVDTSSTNEIQDLSLTGNSLRITKNSSATVIDLSKYVDNTDQQTLSRNGSSLSISNGNSIDVSDMINLPWVGFSCQKNSEVTIPKQSTSPGIYDIQWDIVDNLNSVSSFESSTKFLVPSSGVYQIAISLIFDKSVTVQVIRGSNEVVREYLPYFGSFLSTNLLLNLNSGDKISIRLINYSNYDDVKIRKGDFNGYRIH